MEGGGPLLELKRTIGAIPIKGLPLPLVGPSFVNIYRLYN